MVVPQLWNGKVFAPNTVNSCSTIEPQCLRSRVSDFKRRLIRRWDSQASGGTDAWRRVEWKQFTLDMLAHLAELHTSIEEEAVALPWEVLAQIDAWSEEALFSPVATIPMDDTSQIGPLDLPPNTATSLLYTSWASTRCRDLRDCAVG